MVFPSFESDEEVMRRLTTAMKKAAIQRSSHLINIGLVVS